MYLRKCSVYARYPLTSCKITDFLLAIRVLVHGLADMQLKQRRIYFSDTHPQISETARTGAAAGTLSDRPKKVVESAATPLRAALHIVIPLFTGWSRVRGNVTRENVCRFVFVVSSVNWV